MEKKSLKSYCNTDQTTFTDTSMQCIVKRYSVKHNLDDCPTEFRICVSSYISIYISSGGQAAANL